MLELNLIILGVITAGTLTAAIGGPQIGFRATFGERLAAIAVGEDVLISIGCLRRSDE